MPKIKASELGIRTNEVSKINNEDNRAYSILEVRY